MLDFSCINLGDQFDRTTLAKVWKYKSEEAIQRGVVTPKGENQIIIFVTYEKKNFETAYKDYIDGNILHWEGEKKHRSDARIATAKDKIYFFYRKEPRSKFEFKGLIKLRSYKLSEDKPSTFTFYINEAYTTTTEQELKHIRLSSTLEENLKEALINSCTGQGIYRDQALSLWKDCSLTSFSDQQHLIATHIKPWLIASYSERLDPNNSLLLLPTTSYLFKNGLVSFDPNGGIEFSKYLNSTNINRLNIDPHSKIKFRTEEIRKYLKYHREYVFNMIEL